MNYKHNTLPLNTSLISAIPRSKTLRIRPSSRLGFLLIPLGLPALADEIKNPPVTLPEVTIQAPAPYYWMEKASTANRPTTVYDESDLNIAHERTVDEVLQGEPGLGVIKTDAEGIGNLHIRGVGGQGLMSLDGMPILSSLPGITNLNAVLPEGLQRMEVSRGFAPASQGFSALGGSIRMTSREAINNGGDLRVEGGSFGTLRETLRGTLANDRGGIALMANRTDVFDGMWVAPRHEGNPERDPSHGTQVLTRAGQRMTDWLEWEGSLLYRQNLNAWDQLGMNRGRLTKVDDRNAFFSEEAWLTQNTLKAHLTNDWASRLQLGYTQNRNHIETSGLQLGYEANLYLARWENDHRIWRGGGNNSVHLLWGAEGRHESGSAPSYIRTGPASFAAGRLMNEERTQQAGFLETRFTYEKLSGDLGVRHEAYDRFTDQTLFHAGAAWQWTQTLKLKANGGNGFRIPGYAERLFPLIGQPGLKPERGAGGDLGLEWSPIKNLEFNLTGFYHRYSDLIAITWNPMPTPQIPCGGECLLNIARATTAGMETRGEYRFNDEWLAGATYTYNDTQNLDTNGRIPFESLNTFRVFGEWRPWQPVSLWMEGIYRDQYYNDVGNTVAIHDTFHLNTRLDYRVSDQLKFYVRGENLTDNITPYVISLNQTGAAVYGGVMLELK